MNITRLRTLAGVPLVEEENTSIDTSFIVGAGMVMVMRENVGGDVDKFAKMLNVPDGWVLTKVTASMWGAYRSQVGLALFTDISDYPDDPDRVFNRESV